jgi:hypothetical protein
MDNSTTSNASGLPRRRVSASKAAASIAHQLDSDESSDLEVIEVKEDMAMRKERVKVKVKKGTPTETRYGSQADAAVSTTSMVVSTSSHRPGPLPTDKKGLLCLAIDLSLITESDASDLTSLPSSTTSPIDNVPTLSRPPFVPLASRRGLEYGLTELNEPPWSVADLGSYVWVLLEPKSNRVYNPDRDEDDCKERLWWPAKVCVQYTLSLEETIMFTQLAVDPRHN